MAADRHRHVRRGHRRFSGPVQLQHRQAVFGAVLPAAGGDGGDSGAAGSARAQQVEEPDEEPGADECEREPGHRASREAATGGEPEEERVRGRVGERATEVLTPRRGRDDEQHRAEEHRARHHAEAGTEPAHEDRREDERRCAQLRRGRVAEAGDPDPDGGRVPEDRGELQVGPEQRVDAVQRDERATVTDYDGPGGAVLSREVEDGAIENTYQVLLLNARDGERAAALQVVADPALPGLTVVSDPRVALPAADSQTVLLRLRLLRLLPRLPRRLMRLRCSRLPRPLPPRHLPPLLQRPLRRPLLILMTAALPTIGNARRG